MRVWMMATGVIAAASLSAAACSQVEPETPDTAQTADAPSAEDGAQIYAFACEQCHGAQGQGGPGGGAPFTDTLSIDVIVEVATYGRNNMPAFQGIYDEDELRDAGAYILERLVPR